MGKDYANGTGEKTQYFYDRETVEMLCDAGAFGFNYFYYTPGDAAKRRQMTF